MTWRTLLTAWTTGCCVAIAAPALSKALVVRSAGPSANAYPPGKALPDSAKISLKPGDSVTILGPNATKTLRGPGTFPASSSSAEGLAMAAARRTRFGAMRSGDLALNPSPWNLDISQSGTICIAKGSPLKMWRPSSEDAAKLIITLSSGKATTVNWPAGKSTIDWPAALPISEGVDYQLALKDGPSPESVRFSLMPALPSDAVDTAEALIQRGCQNQLDVLVAELGDGE
ncbi:hypothetical protein H9L14_05195 [Sphingomonas sediminicola]|uniref:DUF4384 domain-containing protein n=1 Tax=Sphingomonas sediminicola TaxID=386874 RepID=A0ABX6T9J7_9SPHN|nr:hypothetical protein [Sphingomonas sediminicola]QNP46532.1 hypothetical protein H9L14_05195 [Sphingomonas sediminicola]